MKKGEEGQQQIRQNIEELIEWFKQAQKEIKELMATAKDFQDTIALMATELDAIVKRLSTVGMSAAEEDAALKALNDFNDKLKSVATS